MDPEPSAQEHWIRQAILAGDEQAWKSLYEKHFDSLYAFVNHRVGKNAATTEEILQETWLIAVRKIGSFDPAKGCFDAWLKGIAENLWRNRRRADHREESKKQNVMEGWEHDIPAPSDEGPVASHGVAEGITLAFQQLPGQYETVLRAKYEERLSVESIADRMGKSPKAVESLLSRARGAFRRVFDKLRRKENEI